MAISFETAREYGDAVLCAVLCGEPRALEVVSRIITPDQMPTEQSGTILRAAIELVGQGVTTPDLPSIDGHLRKTRKLTRAGGSTHVASIQDMLADVANVDWYAKELKRFYLSKGATVAAVAFQDDPSPKKAEALSRAVDTLKAWDEGGANDDPTRGNVEEHQGELSTRKTTPPIDVGLGGLTLAPGELAVLIGPQKLGKSALACQLADTVAKQKRPVLYFTFEMPPFEVWARIIAQNSTIGSRGSLFYSKAVRGTWSEDDRKAYRRTLEGYHGRELIRVVQPDPARADEGSAAWVRRVVEGETERRGVAPFVVVDYLQRVREPKQTDRRLEVGEAAYQLRAMVDTLQAPALVLASIARGKYPTGGSDSCFPPSEDAAKESGEIEYSATSIYALWPTSEYFTQFIKGNETPPADRPVPLALHRLLHRHGGDGEKVRELMWWRGEGRFDVPSEV